MNFILIFFFIKPPFFNTQDLKSSTCVANPTSDVSEIKESDKKNMKNISAKGSILSDFINVEEQKLSEDLAISSKSLKGNGLLNREDIKFAMMRLGATSLNSINALSFNYVKRNSCPL